MRLIISLCGIKIWMFSWTSARCCQCNWHLRNEMLYLCHLETWDMRKSQSGPPVYLNVNMSISNPCVHTFMYVFKVTCKPGLSCVTEQKEFWRQYFVTLTNSSSTVMLKHLFHAPSLPSGNTSEGRTESHRWNTFEFAPLFLLNPLIWSGTLI